jgi:hypothetical protein
MAKDVTVASTESADVPKPRPVTTVNRPRRRRHRPTIVDDAAPDWEWEDWAARFWDSEPHVFTGDDPRGDAG